MSDYQFSQDWFSANSGRWLELILMLGKCTKILEIGAFEGRSAVWLIENALKEGGHLYCIDTWAGSAEHSAKEIEGIESRFLNNVAIALSKSPKTHVIPLKGTSRRCLAELIRERHEATFDFIYVDGSHAAWDTLTDACMSFGLLRRGGVMVFDDYLWGDPVLSMHRPKIAIDSFVNVFMEHLEVVHSGYQFAIRKL